MKAFTDILTSLSNTQAAMTQTLNLLNEKINNTEEQPRQKENILIGLLRCFRSTRN